MTESNIQNFLTAMPIFVNQDATAIQALATELTKKKIAKGTILFSQGDPGDAVYIVTSGKFRISLLSGKDRETNIIDVLPGECIGEMALLTGQPRNATVMALEDSELLCLVKTAFDHLTEKYPMLLNGLTSQLLPRFQQDQTSVVLTHLFGKLDDDLLHQLLGRLGWCHLHSGQTLFRQDEPGHEMYVVVQGRLRLVVEDVDGKDRILGEVGAGECIGEFALLAEDNTPENLRSATVYATRSTDLIVITRSIFEDLTSQYPLALLNLTRQIARRSAATNKPAPCVEDHFVIALLPSRVGQALDEFAKQFTDSLTVFGPVQFLSATSFNELYGKEGAAETPLDASQSVMIKSWLDQRERENKYTIYDVSPGIDESGQLTKWMQRCAEDADLILLVGEAESDPCVTPVEKLLPTIQSRTCMELVLFHPAGCQTPRGTAEWLKLRSSGDFPIQAHHHVRAGNRKDFRRLARRIARAPIGLTLSGGGARGWAHVGVLRAIEEMQLDFDWVAGASMGAIVAAGIAMDLSSESLSELAAKFSDPKKLLDYTFPYTSLTATKRITTLLQAQYQGADIEDTWHPFFCVSADLTNGEERIHTSGALWKAVRASMAFPGIFAPVTESGCVLIDGGAANNLPIDRMRERCPHGTVIGVNLLTQSPVSGGYDFGPSLSGWKTVASRLLPTSKRIKIPHMMNIISGLVYSNNRYRLNESWRCADLLIEVPVEAFGLLEFDQYAQIIDAGYRAAQEQLTGFEI